MPEVVYPPRFHQRVLAQEAPGDRPVVVSVVVPTVTVPGGPFTVKVAALDERGFPSLECGGKITLRGPGSSAPIAEVGFARGQPAVAEVRGVVAPGEGLFRLEAELGGDLFVSNPTCCTRTPEYRIYWGDPHVHTVLSACHAALARSLNFCYTAGRYLCALDWVAATDHVSNGRCDFSKWKEQCAVCDLYNDPPEFVTLPAYEASLKGGAGGDNNVYMLRAPEMFVDEYVQGNVKTLCEKLAQVLSEDEFFVVPHHTTRTGKHGELDDTLYPGPDLMPVIEIHSKWGTSEYRGNPNPLKGVHPGPSYAVDFLNRGLPLGFIAGTDTHATMPSGVGIKPALSDSIEPGHIDRLPGLSAVRARELTREAVFRGIRQRQCYAASLERIYLEGTVAGHPFGSRAERAHRAAKEPRTVQVASAGQSDITSIELIRNGEVIHRHPGTGWHETMTYTDEDDFEEVALRSAQLGTFIYYYVRVTCASGAQAWSSPVWLCESEGS